MYKLNIFVYIFVAMSTFILDGISESGDPSDAKQRFFSLDFKIQCCRYWWFEIWNGERLSFPFWRLYWNKNEGAYVYYNKKIHLSPNKMYLIPPHTPYSTGIANQRTNESIHNLFKCGKISSEKSEKEHLNKGDILHFFMHFTMGRNYDNVAPDIYELTLDQVLLDRLNNILKTLLDGTITFGESESLDMYNLALSAVNRIMPKISFSNGHNPSIGRIIDFMEKHIDSKLTDQRLADVLSMSTGSFSRMFKKNTGKSPSAYLRQIRIAKASNLLLYTDTNIDNIAEVCGFSDRYHLTKVFGQIKKTSPAAFRKSAGYF